MSDTINLGHLDLSEVVVLELEGRGAEACGTRGFVAGVQLRFASLADGPRRMHQRTG